MRALCFEHFGLNSLTKPNLNKFLAQLRTLSKYFSEEQNLRKSKMYEV